MYIRHGPKWQAANLLPAAWARMKHAACWQAPLYKVSSLIDPQTPDKRHTLRISSKTAICRMSPQLDTASRFSNRNLTARSC
jgi:hypothetical protein